MVVGLHALVVLDVWKFMYSVVIYPEWPSMGIEKQYGIGSTI